MPLTPEDVVNKRFNATRVREGYAIEEVDDFLDEVVGELRRLLAENDELRENLRRCEQRVRDLNGELARLGEERTGAVPAAATGVTAVHAPVALSAADGDGAGAQAEPDALAGDLDDAVPTAAAVPADEVVAGEVPGSESASGDAAPEDVASEAMVSSEVAADEVAGDDVATDGDASGSADGTGPVDAPAPDDLPGAEGLAPSAEAAEPQDADQPAPQAEVALSQDAAQPAPGSDPVQQAAGVLALAQRLHDEYLRDAEGQRQRIVSDARTHAEQLVAQAREQRERTLSELEEERLILESAIDALRTFEHESRSRLSEYFQNQLDELRRRTPIVGEAATADQD